MQKMGAFDYKSGMKSNIIGFQRRGGGVTIRHKWAMKLSLGYLDWAVANEPPGTERRKELLLLRMSVIPGYGKPNLQCRRLRTCRACDRPYLGRRRAFRRDYGHFCPGCRQYARKTPLALHEKAVRPAKARYRLCNRLARIHGDPVVPLPTHCKHPGCQNRAVQTWLTPNQRRPIMLCHRHRIQALKNAVPLRPRPRGRPRKSTRKRLHMHAAGIVADF